MTAYIFEGQRTSPVLIGKVSTFIKIPFLGFLLDPNFIDILTCLLCLCQGWGIEQKLSIKLCLVLTKEHMLRCFYFFMPVVRKALCLTLFKTETDIESEARNHP